MKTCVIRVRSCPILKLSVAELNPQPLPLHHCHSFMVSKLIEVLHTHYGFTYLEATLHFYLFHFVCSAIRDAQTPVMISIQFDSSSLQPFASDSAVFFFWVWEWRRWHIPGATRGAPSLLPVFLCLECQNIKVVKDCPIESVLLSVWTKDIPDSVYYYHGRTSFGFHNALRPSMSVIGFSQYTRFRTGWDGQLLQSIRHKFSTDTVAQSVGSWTKSEPEAATPLRSHRRGFKLNNDELENP